MIRAGTACDAHEVFEMVCELADYERLRHLVTGSAEDLARCLEESQVHLLVCEEMGVPVGYALYFYNFSTFLMKPGLYIEDIYVRTEHRGNGYGRDLLEALISIARDRNCGRVEWSVLDWNELAIGFYERMGAQVLPDWRICRLVLD